MINCFRHYLWEKKLVDLIPEHGDNGTYLFLVGFPVLVREKQETVA